MERGENNSRRRIGSFKADINMYGERNLEGSAALRKPHLEILEVQFQTTIESLVGHIVLLICPFPFLVIIYCSSLKFSRSPHQ